MNLDDEFRAYKLTTLPRVTTPGAEVIWRTVYRRQRRRIVVTGAFATVAVGAFGVQMLTAPSGTVGLGPTTPPVSPSPVLSPSLSASPSASPSSASSISPSAVASRPPTTASTFSSKVDLSATGPAQAILTPANGRYEGVMTATFHNNGAGTYAFGVVRVTLPAGATFDFQGIPSAEWGMEACSIQTDQVWECVARPSVIPARGGLATAKFHIVVNVAPQAQPMTLEGGRIQPVAFTINGERKEAPDATPADNVHKFTLLLNPS